MPKARLSRASHRDAKAVDNGWLRDGQLVAEVRRHREAYAAKFGYDLKAICQDLRRKTVEAAKSGRRVLEPPRSPSKGPKRRAG